MMKVAIIDCEPSKAGWQGPHREGGEDGDIYQNAIDSYLGNLFVGAAKYHVFKAYHQELPSMEHEDYDALIVGGSQYSVYERNEIPWIEQVLELIRVSVSRKIKVIGICFGAQCIAQAFPGGHVDKNPSGKLVFKAEKIKLVPGYEQYLFPNSAKKKDETIVQTKSHVTLFETHNDCAISLPENSVLLGSSHSCAHEIFLVENYALAIQGHPELSILEMLDYVLPGHDLSGRLSGTEAMESFKTITEDPVDNEYMWDLISRFIVYGKIPLPSLKTPKNDDEVSVEEEIADARDEVIVSLVTEVEELKKQIAALLEENKSLREQLNSNENKNDDTKQFVTKKRAYDFSSLPLSVKGLLSGRGGFKETTKLLENLENDEALLKSTLVIGDVEIHTEKDLLGPRTKLIQPIQEFSDIHPKNNVLCCRLIKDPSTQEFLMFSTGAIDKTLTVTSVSLKATKASNILARYVFEAPVVAMEFHPFAQNPMILALGLLDGQVLYLHWTAEQGLSPNVVVAHSRHSKSITRLRWSQDGTILASASRDYSVRVSRWSEKGPIGIQQEILCESVPEAIDFVYLDQGKTMYLIVCVRDAFTFQYVPILQPNHHHNKILDPENMKVISLTEDVRVSFTVLDILAAPNSENFPIILVATDKSRIILYEAGTFNQLRMFEGHVCDEYGRPSLVWHPSGKYILCASDKGYADGYSICQWDVATSKIKARFVGHRGSIRDLSFLQNNHKQDGDDDDHHHQKEFLLSCSFDKTLKLWNIE